MPRVLMVPIALAALLAPVTLARAEILGGVGPDPVKLQADQLDIDILAGEATLTGKVTLTKGDLVVNCPRIDLRFEHAPKLTWARGSGGVTADVRGVHAEAPSVELDLTKQVLDLRGGVKLTRGQGWLTADSARIEIATAKVSLTQVKGAIPVAKGP
ncbi:MAG TPA: LptA/OstA family protein [Polyangiaceae bacterium]|nr:LptA/OstA family protein [Polyangiaceae bacterium]